MKRSSALPYQFEVYALLFSFAAERGDTKTVEMYKDIPNMINQADSLGNTALMLAASNGHTDTLVALCNTNGVNVNLQNYAGDTALMLAIQFKHLKAIKVLLSATVTHDLSIKNVIDETAKSLALELQDPTLSIEITRWLDLYALTKQQHNTYTIVAPTPFTSLARSQSTTTSSSEKIKEDDAKKPRALSQ